MDLKTVDEGSSAYLTVTFKDKNGQPTSPTSITYRIDCLTNDQQVRDDTSVGPAAEIEIHLTAADNAIISQTNRTETKLVTVKASYGADDKVNASYQYIVKNLKKIT